MESLVEENARLRQEVAELKSAKERLERRVQKLERRVQELERRVEGLLRALEEARRAGKRQAAPFSRQEAKADPARPGRKAGVRYGSRNRRAIPARIEQTLAVELPGCCPRCGGELEETRIEKQYQTELPQPKVERIGFRIHVGRCKRCGRRVPGRHPRQTSDAVGGAASQLGARKSQPIYL
jgi:transposase